MTCHLDVDLIAVEVEGPREQPVRLQVEDAWLALLVAVTDVHRSVHRHALERLVDRLDDPVGGFEERQRLRDLHDLQPAGGEILELGVVCSRDVQRERLEISVVLVGGQRRQRRRPERSVDLRWLVGQILDGLQDRLEHRPAPVHRSEHGRLVDRQVEGPDLNPVAERGVALEPVGHQVEELGVLVVGLVLVVLAAVGDDVQPSVSHVLDRELDGVPVQLTHPVAGKLGRENPLPEHLSRHEHRPGVGADQRGGQ